MEHPSRHEPETFFAPPERGDSDEILALSRQLERDETTQRLLDAIPGFAVVLDDHRQIVAANSRTRSLLNDPKVTELSTCATIDKARRSIQNPEAAPIGLRPGEAFGCIRAWEAPSGCGTSEHCKTCGVAIALCSARDGTRSSEECSIVIDQGALEFDAVVTPFDFRGHRLVVLALRDISGEKRRRALERFFFHDVLNTAGGLQGLCDVVTELQATEPMDQSGQDGEAAEYLELMHRAAGYLVREIRAQQQLMAAEAGELEANPEPLQLLPFLQEIVRLSEHLDVAEGRPIRVLGDEATLTTDSTILHRVILNLVKNALEASEPGHAVTIAASATGSDIRISVHNDSVMPETVRLQIFRRSFSTKAAQGRGLGTYSVKLLTEGALQGDVDFVSREGEGTTFTVRLPAVLARRAA